MFILVPWNPVVVIWLVLSGHGPGGMRASRFVEGKPLYPVQH